MQSQSESFFEALLSTLIGFVLSYVVGLVVYPLFGFNVTPSQNLLVILIFTLVSLIRGYCIRRWFNGKIQRVASSLASQLEQ